MLLQALRGLDPATELCLVAAGVFFLFGLLTGVWKYWHHATSPAAATFQ